MFHNYFFPFLEGFDYVVANDIADLDAKLDDTVCAILIEYVQGEGGVMALEQDFVDAIYDRCAKRDILVMTDEVQTGMGRKPAHCWQANSSDIMLMSFTLAKGIAGGLPMGACLANEKCSGVLGKSAHGSTFGGNPVCCAGGLAVLQTLTADWFPCKRTGKGCLSAGKAGKAAACTGSYRLRLDGWYSAGCR